MPTTAAMINAGPSRNEFGDAGDWTIQTSFFAIMGSQADTVTVPPEILRTPAEGDSHHCPVQAVNVLMHSSSRCVLLFLQQRAPRRG
jgi:hypothetical protein